MSGKPAGVRVWSIILPAVGLLLGSGGIATAKPEAPKVEPTPGVKTRERPSSAAGARRPGAKSAASEAQRQRCKVQMGPGGRRSIRCTGIVITSTVPRPRAFYLLQRSTPEYQAEALGADLVQRVTEVVSRAPF